MPDIGLFLRAFFFMVLGVTVVAGVRAGRVEPVYNALWKRTTGRLWTTTGRIWARRHNLWVAIAAMAGGMLWAKLTTSRTLLLQLAALGIGIFFGRLIDGPVGTFTLILLVGLTAGHFLR